jgi:hypothetical protein
MDAKLTLKLDREAIQGAKLYADSRGTSLSRVVESYFRHLAAVVEPAAERPLSGGVAELAGVLKGMEIENPREEYTEFLLRKYS